MMRISHLVHVWVLRPQISWGAVNSGSWLTLFLNPTSPPLRPVLLCGEVNYEISHETAVGEKGFWSWKIIYNILNYKPLLGMKWPYVQTPNVAISTRDHLDSEKKKSLLGSHEVSHLVLWPWAHKLTSLDSVSLQRRTLGLARSSLTLIPLSYQSR